MGLVDLLAPIICPQSQVAAEAIPASGRCAAGGCACSEECGGSDWSSPGLTLLSSLMVMIVLPPCALVTWLQKLNPFPSTNPKMKKRIVVAFSKS